MTKEVLEKEAEKNILNLKNNSIKVNGKPFQINEGDYTQGYLDSAEPREKRIEELEKENAELKEHIKADCIDCADYIKNQKLEKENAELKARLQKKINTTTVSDYPYSALKLEEAKEILQVVLGKWKEERWILQSEEEVKQIEKLMKQTEQFLKEVEK